MGTNRIEAHFRDPSLDRPAEDFYVVRVPWTTFFVDEDNALRLISAMTGMGGAKVVRCETITGSVAYVRPSSVLYVQQCTKAQRDAERRHWKRHDDEDESDLGLDE
ncbi:MAG: hypothetical protein AAF389_11795 [Gemmatimonadota bacterium]